ncbi:MAG: [LysW]-aminoadipate kinase [Planctomycetota bacterium]|nr:[LysW]-aminoadipate kinase [Planctomycetota bacterium]
MSNPSSSTGSLRPLVVKIGGSEGVDRAAVCTDIAAIVRGGQPVVVVHGGSHDTNQLCQRLGIPVRTITSPSGHTSRRTDAQTLQAFQMACRGIINQQLVTLLLGQGVNAVGLSGLDARLWQGERKGAVRAIENGVTVIIRDDYTGSVEQADPRLLSLLLDAGYTPVISPPAISTQGEAINVDADRAAARTAAAVRAETLVLLSNVPGVLERFPDESSLVSRVSRERVEEYVGLAQGRMKKKIMSAGEALRDGVSTVVIADARVPEPVRSALSGKGTRFE